MRYRRDHVDVPAYFVPDQLLQAGARRRYHGILAIKHGSHALLDNSRINLEFRKAG